MPLRSLLQYDRSFSSEEIAVLTVAFEDALAMLELINYKDLATLMIAKAIIRAAKDGERDPIRLREAAIKSL